MSRSVRLVFEPAIDAGKAVLRQLPVGNLIANYVGVGWTNLLSLVAIPIYIRALGTEQWGLVAACMSLQVVFSLLDTGLAQVMPRWIALADVSALESIVIAFRRLYTAVALCALAGGQLFADLIATHLFRVQPGATDDLVLCLRLILLQLFFQFINNANVGFWNGLQRQKMANWRICLFATAKHAIALAMALHFRTAWAYAVGFAAAACVECVTNWVTVSGALGEKRSEKSADVNISTIFRDSGLTTIAAVLGALVAQLDRVTMATAVSTAQFGVYIVLLNLSSSFLQLQSPLVRALYPRMALEGVAGEGGHSMRALFIGTMLVCATPCLIGAALSGQILGLWLHNKFFVSEGALPLTVLLIAASLNGVYNVIYSQLLAQGRPRNIFLINVICLVALGLEAILLRGRLGLLLGCLMVFTNSSLQLILGETMLLLRSRSRSTPSVVPAL